MAGWLQYHMYSVGMLALLRDHAASASSVASMPTEESRQGYSEREYSSREKKAKKMKP